MRLLQSERGNVAITFALALIPICIMIGGAVDFSRAMSAKRQLRDTLDGAALAIGAVPNFTQAQAQQMATDFANANFPSQSMGAPAKIDSITISDTELTINGSADVPTVMLGLIGINNMKVKTDVKVQRAGWNVEASLALDITGSMAGSRLSDLKTAANDFVDTVIQDAQFPYTSKAAIVPYANSVNVGGLAAQTRGPVTPGNCTLYDCSQYKFTGANGKSYTLNLTNCVAERPTTNQYNDSAPNAGNGWFYKVYSGADPCPTNQIVPLTDSKSTLHNAINALAAKGNTAGHIGIGWGWYMLSPNFSYLFPGSSQPNPYGDKKTMKVAVLMTDGEFNTQYCKGVVSKDATSGVADRINCNAPNGNAFAQAAQLCTNMKKAGLIVYTIGFTITKGGQAETVLKNCATSPTAPYFNTPATGADLKGVFKNIAKSISQLKIAH